MEVETPLPGAVDRLRATWSPLLSARTSVLLLVVFAGLLLAAILVLVGCTSLTPATTSTTAAGAGLFSLADRIYVRGLNQRMALLTDPAWSLTAAEAQALSAGEWGALDGQRMDDAVALAQITSSEAAAQVPPGQAVENLCRRWAVTTKDYYDSLSSLKGAISDQDQGMVKAWLAKVSSVQASLNALLAPFAADLTLPVPPGGRQDLTGDERDYLVDLKEADHALLYPLATMEIALEEGGTGRNPRTVQVPGDLVPRLLQACISWSYMVAPSDRLQEVGASWDGVMTHARQAVDLAEQLPGDAAAVAQLRVILKLAMTESRLVRRFVASFYNLDIAYPRTPIG
jgi:hypothetical protein